MYKRMFSILLRVVISSQPGCLTNFQPFIKYLLLGKHQYLKINYLQCHIITNYLLFHFNKMVYLLDLVSMKKTKFKKGNKMVLPL